MFLKYGWIALILFAFAGIFSKGEDIEVDKRDFPDEFIAASDEIVLEGLSDADFRNVAVMPDGTPAGDAFTVEEAEHMNDRSILLRFGNRRN